MKCWLGGNSLSSGTDPVTGSGGWFILARYKLRIQNLLTRILEHMRPEENLDRYSFKFGTIHTYCTHYISIPTRVAMAWLHA